MLELQLLLPNEEVLPINCTSKPHSDTTSLFQLFVNLKIDSIPVNPKKTSLQSEMLKSEPLLEDNINLVASEIEKAEFNRNFNSAIKKIYKGNTNINFDWFEESTILSNEINATSQSLANDNNCDLTKFEKIFTAKFNIFIEFFLNLKNFKENFLGEYFLKENSKSKNVLVDSKFDLLDDDTNEPDVCKFSVLHLSLKFYEIQNNKVVDLFTLIDLNLGSTAKFSILPHYLTFNFIRVNNSETEIEFPLQVDFGSRSKNLSATLYILHGFITFNGLDFITYTRLREKGVTFSRCLNGEVTSVNLFGSIKSKGVRVVIYCLQEPEKSLTV
ncbi:hypothetical protein HK099_002900 [Clydaea vesicula]|uniref:Uncharacterized protein n=1 Tax=Clydaea vesicula TaxID=447962 RepID=A0AAD5XZK2_9FUNG|nr:hypothetical protein HK099_002900 [Clydaea vesicula]